ncbi:CubicO group peptidase, beta-lactamase class C family [Clostridium collagenovorans DSM 3089]|uniref:CubicO group peptidase, beta-lactamase class C family n=1 Tax=Clostridium collagenovorans DSM 3089 TaxID=1121306 RepID=A0A1M5S3K1_9CLOT|nr:serine hydrolase domain-containing protein [Clostridium collagenovorans]SHH33071.1 CubicO group peptidase, beta-lactamase class C family [Clostridium collagenovorans DSM 3089]
MSINYKINEYMNAYTELWPFSGAVVVSDKGKVIFNESYGMANIEHSVRNTIKTKYKIASLTKQITCMGIMILKEMELLSTEDSIKKFFPDYAEFDERITIHHLMTHTSGLYNDFSVIDPYLIMGKCLLTQKEIFHLFKDMPLEFEPGEGWSYCFFGYYLLGVIIERVSGKSYIQFIKDNIFDPLGMNNSGIDDYREILHDKASGYFSSGDKLICSEIDTMSAFSAGALYSTITDMLLWDEALYSEKLISKETMKEIFTPYKEGYGYGWVIDSYLNRKRVRHSGGGNGFNHQFHRYMDDKVTILVLSNYGFSNSISINENIAKIVFGDEYPMPSKPKEYNLDLNVYDSNYAGIYEEEYFKYEFKRDKDKLYFIQEDKWIMPIYPISETIFHHTWIDKEYTFQKDEDGKVYFDGIKKRKN